MQKETMTSLSSLFKKAATHADAYNGSESAYEDFMSAAIAFEQAGGARPDVDDLLDRSIRALFSSDDFLHQLQLGGSQVVEQPDIFVVPQTHLHALQSGHAIPYKGPIYDPRLQEIVRALENNKIFFDDLIIDAGVVASSQMRKWPYLIVTIPRMDAQIAVANQYGEALFIAKPIIDIAHWKQFQKNAAGQPGTPFENVKKINYGGDWQVHMLNAVFGELTKPGPKIPLYTYMEGCRTGRQLTPAMIVAMAKMYRERHPQKQWPNGQNGVIDEDIVKAVCGSSARKETWKNIDNLARIGGRGLAKGQTLAQILKRHGCAYALTETMIVQMATLYRQRHPRRRLPTQWSGEIDPAIVIAVTGDPHWQRETWENLNKLLQRSGRELPGGTTLSVLLRNHCREDLPAPVALKLAGSRL